MPSVPESQGSSIVIQCYLADLKCEFSTPDKDCKWCAQRGLACGAKLLGEKHQIREHRKRLGLDGSKLSEIARKLEHAFPRATPWEISDMAREALLEAGDGPQLGRNV
jgi:hypothetical protein